jgi:hypothetical protein
LAILTTSIVGESANLRGGCIKKYVSKLIIFLTVQGVLNNNPTVWLDGVPLKKLHWQVCEN